MSITVIIPAFNSRYLRETLESALAQTLGPEQILVMDDGSTDDTATLAEGFGPPVRVIRQSNMGQSRSRNRGAEMAATEWIAFLDHDDLWAPNKLERQMEELRKDPAADICYTARREFAVENGKLQMGRVTPVPAPGFIGEALYRNTTFMPSSVVIRRSTFLRFGGFDPRFNNVEDWDLWLRLYHGGVLFAGCAEPLLLYRRHALSASHDALPSLRMLKQIYREQVFPHLPRSTRWLSLLRAYSGQESVAAMDLRESGRPGYLGVMATSILRHPFHSRHRYKVFAHMLYTRTKQAFGINRGPRPSLPR